MAIPAIIVHGGAFNIPHIFVERYNAGTKHAARVGYDCLIQGGSALDAVERAVNALEDNTAFNAGHGASLTEIGTVEMDAIIVDGSNLKTGAVGCVRDIANPVSLARKVMDKTPHCLLVADGAMKFAKNINFPILDDPTELITKDAVCRNFKIMEGGDTFNAHIEAYMNTIIHSKDTAEIEKLFQKMMKKNEITKENGHDTVGAVAIDTNGLIACATSTGGMPGKMLGRVGDSPLIGSGAFANSIGGCSTTGHGESILRATTAREAVRFLEEGCSANEAAKKAVDRTLELTGGRCGLILIDKRGNIGHAETTGSMAWASINRKESRFALRTGDEKVADF